MTNRERYNHLNHIFNLIDGNVLKCPKCGFPYIEGYICANCSADNFGNEEEYPMGELLEGYLPEETICHQGDDNQTVSENLEEAPEDMYNF